jgi:hypothetical protein
MKLKKISSLLVLTSLVWVLSISCSTPAPSDFTSKSTIRDESVARLKPGMSEKEVMEILGSKPQSRLTLPDGNTELTWSLDYSVKGVYEEKEGKTISILFAPDGKMLRVLRQR